MPQESSRTWLRLPEIGSKLYAALRWASTAFGSMTRGEFASYGRTETRMTWKLLTTNKAKQSGERAKRLKPVHLGEILREEFLTLLGLSANKLALDLRVPVTRISEIVNERRSISPETALRLAQYFNTPPEFWMN